MNDQGSVLWWPLVDLLSFTQSGVRHTQKTNKKGDFMSCQEDTLLETEGHKRSLLQPVKHTVKPDVLL